MHKNVKYLIHFAGPDDPLFNRFKAWYIREAGEARENHRQFPNPANFMKWEWGDTSPVGPYMRELDWWAQATLTWLQEHLVQGTFPREDYWELCEFLNIVLGGEVCKP